MRRLADRLEAARLVSVLATSWMQLNLDVPQERLVRRPAREYCAALTQQGRELCTMRQAESLHGPG